ncbi:hypothetical protein FA10DRAFT_268784 [Acaromyces ingoldii]|uniref:Ubiquinol-cytochrome c chaperone domain-containing protein n=1 Tax=Acaromyces ingoldii TaxID=215250 RepID=A0A316YGQ9_9BASI|nr:hypothetical protein FA10DRAFT_268784 [Acaromyces ingoldii]PWN88607.1 hypothetical protein FA10DRAFT_268784 [Acaromyces ingoldii]
MLAATTRAARVGAVSRRQLERSFASQARVLLQQQQQQQAAPAKEAGRLQPSPLSPSAPPPKKHSALTVSLVKGLARIMGYNSTTSTAIRVSSDLYDRCAERADIEAAFWYGECGLPRTYQTWFQITNLHIHLLLVRFRMLVPAKKANSYSQELINHFFIDAESRMRLRFGVQTSRLVKGYMRDMHTQQRGAVLGLDDALARSYVAETERQGTADADAVLATAIWRNIWGAGGWGSGVAGVKRKLKGVDRPDEDKNKRKSKEQLEQEKREQEEEEEEGMPELAPDLGVETSGRGAYAIAAAAEAARAKAGTPPQQHLPVEPRFPADNLAFANALERVVNFYRRETVRLAKLSDAEIERGRVFSAPSPATQQQQQQQQQQTVQDKLELLGREESIANFTKI